MHGKTICTNCNKIIMQCRCMDHKSINYLICNECSCPPTKGKTMDFSEALKLIKQGEKLTRRGWNGKNMFVFYQKAYPNGIPLNKNTAEALSIAEGTIKKFRPYLMLQTAKEDLCPWSISNSDALAEDWIVYE